jgi:hypothetical protein
VPPAEKATLTPPTTRETEEFVVPLLGGRCLAVQYPKALVESEIHMLDGTFAMIRASIRA